MAGIISFFFVFIVPVIQQKYIFTLDLYEIKLYFKENKN